MRPSSESIRPSRRSSSELNRPSRRSSKRTMSAFVASSSHGVEPSCSISVAASSCPSTSARRVCRAWRRSSLIAIVPPHRLKSNCQWEAPPPPSHGELTTTIRRGCDTITSPRAMSSLCHPRSRIPRRYPPSGPVSARAFRQAEKGEPWQVQGGTKRASAGAVARPRSAAESAGGHRSGIWREHSSWSSAGRQCRSWARSSTT